MKYTRALLLTAFLLMPALAVAQNTVQDRHPEWFACQKDADCTLTCEPCGDTSMNAKFASHSSEVLLACLQALPCFPDAMPQCVDKKCMMRVPESK